MDCFENSFSRSRQQQMRPPELKTARLVNVTLAILLAIVIFFARACSALPQPRNIAGREDVKVPSCPQLLPTYSVTPPPTTTTSSGNNSEVRILGGTKAALGLETSLVYIFASDSTGTTACTGVLVAPSIVATAAHCNVTEDTTLLLNFRGRVRGRERDPDSAFGEAFRHATRVERPAVFEESLRLNESNADIMLLHLNWPAPRSSVPMLVNSDPLLPLPLAAVRAAGYGRTTVDGFTQEDTGNELDNLYQVDLPVIGTRNCQEMLPGSLNGVNEFCTGYDHGRCDTCDGDGGGPLFQFDPEGRPVLVGIVSRGRGCGIQNSPRLNTRVATFLSLFSEYSIMKTGSAVQVLVGESDDAVSPSPTPTPSRAPGESGTDDRPSRGFPISESPVLLIVLVLVGVVLVAALLIAFFAYKCTR